MINTMIKTTMMVVAMLSASAALANDNGRNSGEKGGSPVGPLGNLMTSGINPIYHPWMMLGVPAGSGSFGYAGTAYGYAGRPLPAARRMSARRRTAWGPTRKKTRPACWVPDAVACVARLPEQRKSARSERL